MDRLSPAFTISVAPALAAPFIEEQSENGGMM